MRRTSVVPRLVEWNWPHSCWGVSTYKSLHGKLKSKFPKLLDSKILETDMLHMGSCVFVRLYVWIHLFMYVCPCAFVRVVCACAVNHDPINSGHPLVSKSSASRHRHVRPVSEWMNGKWNVIIIVITPGKQRQLQWNQRAAVQITVDL